MRRSSTNIRGLLGVAASGTGLVLGSMEVVECHGPFQPDELGERFSKHRVPEEWLVDYAGPKGLYAWEMRNAVRFDNPTPYRHPPGAVIWVKLDPPIEAR